MASKNVGMLFRTQQDIDKYKGAMRYDFAAEMAQVWLQIVCKMPPTSQKELKRDLSDKTLIGEYIGSQEH